MTSPQPTPSTKANFAREAPLSVRDAAAFLGCPAKRALFVETQGL
jgi:hypothetical protein